MNILPAQCRMARAALNWSTQDLAREAKVGISTVSRFETGQAIPISATLNAIRAALEAAGVEFTNGGQPGVRLAAKDPAEVENG